MRDSKEMLDEKMMSADIEMLKVLRRKHRRSVEMSRYSQSRFLPSKKVLDWCEDEVVHVPERRCTNLTERNGFEMHHHQMLTE